MIAASIAATKSPEARTLYYFAAAANGIQNGMTSVGKSNSFHVLIKRHFLLMERLMIVQ